MGEELHFFQHHVDRLVEGSAHASSVYARQASAIVLARSSFSNDKHSIWLIHSNCSRYYASQIYIPHCR